VLDSPLAIAATSVFASNPEAFDRGEQLISEVRDLFDFPGLEFSQDVTDSKALNERRGPMIIVAASGMAEAGRILHHLAIGAPDPRNTILIVGFQAEHTLGRRIVERRPTLKIYGEEIPLRARVEILNGYSAHADRGELRRWVNAVRGSSSERLPVYLVHGEPPEQDALAGVLRQDGFDVMAPERKSTVDF